MKKISSLILILMLVLVMAVPAMAEATATITIGAGLNGHAFTGYQIFSGEMGDADELKNIAWGDGINYESFLAALKEEAAFANCASAADVAKVLSDNGENYAKDFAAIAHKYTKADAGIAIADGATIADGYYLIVDTTENLTSGAYNLSLLQVSGDMEIKNKTGTTSMIKKVIDINDTDGLPSGWQDSADHDIGDDVSFRLEATLAENVSDYDTYKLVFHDTLSAGFTYKGVNKVTVDDEEVDVNAFAFAVDQGKNEMTFSCDDVKEYGATDGSVVAIEYTAILNTHAVIGSVGNPNEAYLEYSNNPNAEGAGTTMSRTPVDMVIVFTYKTVVNKVDQDENPLAGAEFQLEKKMADGSRKIINVVPVEGEQTEFEFIGLDDGTYILTETKIPEGYNGIEAIEFEVTAQHDELNDNPQLIELSCVEADLVKGEVSGFVADTAAGLITTSVMNNFGATLPETGGMGTTVIYIGGAVLIAAALILLVAKKRTGSSK